jgi:hypothetical protein
MCNREFGYMPWVQHTHHTTAVLTVYSCLTAQSMSIIGIRRALTTLWVLSNCRWFLSEFCWGNRQSLPTATAAHLCLCVPPTAPGAYQTSLRHYWKKLLQKLPENIVLRYIQCIHLNFLKPYWLEWDRILLGRFLCYD